MSETVGAWLNLIFGLGVFAMIAAIMFRKRSERRPKAAVDGPFDEAYKVYTKEYDLELRGRNAEQRLLSASPDYANGWLKLGRESMAAAQMRTLEIADAQRQAVDTAVGNIAHKAGCDFALTLLIDQSGSLRDEPSFWVSASAKLLAESLLKRGVSIEVLGFSTVGWQGGFARQKWIAAKRLPKRPGRLCATMHLVYKAFGETSFQEPDWSALCNPNLLRENVDGEALIWAEGRLTDRPEKKRMLIVISDGAPVDDSTMHENGPDYLDRHLRKVIKSVQDDGKIALGAVGIGYPVHEYYDQSNAVKDFAELPLALTEILQMLLEPRDVIAA